MRQIRDGDREKLITASHHIEDVLKFTSGFIECRDLKNAQVLIIEVLGSIEELSKAAVL